MDNIIDKTKFEHQCTILLHGKYSIIYSYLSIKYIFYFYIYNINILWWYSNIKHCINILKLKGMLYPHMLSMSYKICKICKFCVK
jgi:hypothetical protein